MMFFISSWVKKQLVTRIKEKLDDRSPTTGNMMVATQQLLGEDKNQTDPSKKLSAVQRSEAEQYVADARAVGYTPNPDYESAPRPQRNDDPKKPALKAPEAPAPASSGAARPGPE